MIEIIEDKGKVYAIIIYENFHAEGVRFVTPNDFPLQLGYMNHKTHTKLQPHIHNKFTRVVEKTSEVLLIKKGVLKVTFYNDERLPVKEIVLNKGDVILLYEGGHGFEVLEDIEMIEVKQGPYVGEKDKIRF